MAEKNLTKKTVAKKATTKVQEEKTMSKKIENTEVAVVEKAEVKKEVVKKENKKKAPQVTITVMDNDTLKKLFADNGCITRTNANNASGVVYNTFGTQSRVLQQKRAYQLLLTNGHKSTKTGVVATENDDTARFIKWYDELSDAEKSKVNGYDDLLKTKLSASELPRERTVKLTDYDLLVKFIKYMATFTENQVAKAE